MTPSTLQLEQLVAAVIRRLELLGAAPASPVAAGHSHELRAEGAVVSLEWLERHGLPARRLGEQAAAKSAPTSLVLGPGSVLTPSARDWLRQQGVAWRRDTAGSSQSSSGPAPTVWLGWDLKDGAPAAAPTPPGVRLLPRAAWSTTLRELAGRLAAGDRAVVVSDRPGAAAALANREPTVRAAAVRSSADLRAARRELNANLLLVCSGADSALSQEAAEQLRLSDARLPEAWTRDEPQRKGAGG